MMKRIILGTLVLLSACNTSSDDSNLADNCSEIIAAENGVLIQNNYFQALSNGTILSVQSEEEVGFEDAVSNFKITPAFPKDDAGKWQLEFSGNSFEVSGNTLSTSEEVDNGDYLFKMYDLNTGNSIIEYTYDKFEIMFLDEFEKRYLGFYSTNAASKDNAEFAFSDKTFGYLNYANQNGRISKLSIEAADDMWMSIFDIANPVIEMLPYKGSSIELNSGKTLYFTSANGKVKEEVNFDIQFTYYTKDTYKPSSFLLEVRGDEIRIPDDFSNTVFNIVSL